MPQVSNRVSLILVLALLAAGVILFAIGQPTGGGLCIGAATGGSAIPRPVTAPPT